MQRQRWIYPPSVESEMHPPAATQRQLLIGSELAIRNRFSVIKGYSQLLDRAAQQPVTEHEQIARYTSALALEVSGFQGLLQQYFDAARLQWDDTAIDWHAVDLGLLTRQVSKRFVESAELRGSRILHVQSLDGVQGIWDQRWLTEAVAAIMSNALTYSPDGSEIHVTVRRENDHAVVIVSDAGWGIMPDEHEDIFQPFNRGVAAQEHNARGWGLGLFIASRAVIAHGGWLEIESEPGEGSQFMLHLPLIPPHQGPLSA